MVAIASNTSETSTWDTLNGFPSLHSRAREAKTNRYAEATGCKSLNCVEIWQVIYDYRIRLESFSRDPIGFEGGQLNIYGYVDSRVFISTDPSGMKRCVEFGPLNVLHRNKYVDTWGKICFDFEAKCVEEGGVSITNPANLTYEVSTPFKGIGENSYRVKDTYELIQEGAPTVTTIECTNDCGKVVVGQKAVWDIKIRLKMKLTFGLYYGFKLPLPKPLNEKVPF